MGEDALGRGLMNVFASRFPDLEITDVWGDGFEIDVKLNESVNLTLLARELKEELGDTEFEVRLDSADLSKFRISCYPELENEDQVDDEYLEQQTPIEVGTRIVLESLDQPLAGRQFSFVDEHGESIRAEAIRIASCAMPPLREDPALEVLAADGTSGSWFESPGDFLKIAATSIGLPEEMGDVEADLASMVFADDPEAALYERSAFNIVASVFAYPSKLGDQHQDADFNKLIAETRNLIDHDYQTYEITLEREDLETLAAVDGIGSAVAHDFPNLFGAGARSVFAVEKEYAPLPTLPVVTVAINQGGGELPLLGDAADGRAGSADRNGPLRHSEVITPNEHLRRRTRLRSANRRSGWGSQLVWRTFGALVAFAVGTLLKY